MKKIFTLFLVLSATIAFSQIQQLSKLSEGKFIDSKIVYDDTEDVYGYFLLYEFDRKSKEVFELEYVLLDKNLNKVTSGRFIQGVYQNLLKKFDVGLTFVKKTNNEIIFGLYDTMHEWLPVLHNLNSRYRRINLDTFALSDEFAILGNKPVVKKYKAGDVLKAKELFDNQTLWPLNSNHFVLFGSSEYKVPMASFSEPVKIQEKVDAGMKLISVVDPNLNVLWKKKVNSAKDDYAKFWPVASDKDVLVLKKQYLKPKKGQFSEYEVYNTTTGKLLTTLTNSNGKYRMFNDEVKFSDNEIVFYMTLFELKTKNHTSDKCIGYSKIVIDKNTGKELRTDYFLWENLKPHLPVKDIYGNIPKYGNVIINDFVYLKNGNTIAIAEGYDSGSNTKLLDLYVMELDPEMKVKYFQKVEKQPTSLKGDYSGFGLQRENLFDYAYSQKLDNDGNFVFFYANNERDGGTRAKRKNPNWVFGIITYVDGKFEYDKLQLTSKGSQIYPGKAKNGYIRLLEVSENDSELRLEKINY